MKDIIFDMINDSVEGVGIYHHNGGLWLIFTNKERWVIELTKEGKLWYNHIFFQDIFKYFSMDVIENQHYITEWVEDTIQNGIKNTSVRPLNPIFHVEDTIQNGVRDTTGWRIGYMAGVEDAIKNGVKI